MKYRCNDLSNEKYGGRGIGYDKNWETFEGFEKDMGDTYYTGASIERLRVDEGYCRENCKWIDLEYQKDNKRNTVRVDICGVKKSLRSVCMELGINYKALHKKITKHEKGDNINIKDTTEGKIGLKYLIKKNHNIYRCVRINEKIYLIYCGNELQNAEF